MKPSIAQQAAAVRHIHAIAQRSGDASETTLEWASWGLRTLEWLERHPDIVRALAVIYDAFPGSRISDVRETP